MAYDPEPEEEPGTYDERMAEALLLSSLDLYRSYYQRPGPSEDRREFVRCLGCQMMGHYYYECVRCWNCGWEDGHYSYNCTHPSNLATSPYTCCICGEASNDLTFCTTCAAYL